MFTLTKPTCTVEFGSGLDQETMSTYYFANTNMISALVDPPSSDQSYQFNTEVYKVGVVDP